MKKSVKIITPHKNSPINEMMKIGEKSQRKNKYSITDPRRLYGDTRDLSPFIYKIEK